MVVFDEGLGILRSKVSGIQSAEDSQAYMAALQIGIATAKSRARRVLHLCDGRDASVQPATTADAFSAYSSGGMMGVDKVAVILDSALLKLQTKRLYRSSAICLFDDEESALAWLTATE